MAGDMRLYLASQLVRGMRTSTRRMGGFRSRWVIPSGAQAMLAQAMQHLGEAIPAMVEAATKGESARK